MKKYSEYIMQDVRCNLGLEAYDTSKDEEIMEMEREEVFERYLTWNNICGWSSEILAAIGDIYNVTLKEFDT